MDDNRRSPVVPITIPINNDPEKRYNVNNVDRDNEDGDGTIDAAAFVGMNGVRRRAEDDGGALLLYFKNLVVEYVVKIADEIIHIAPTACTFVANEAAAAAVVVRGRLGCCTTIGTDDDGTVDGPAASVTDDG